MVCNEFTFLSADGKTAIHAVEWLPEGEVRFVLQIAHGVAEYILRYAPLAEFLTARGFAVVGHDHLGHGSSVAEGAPRLYFGPKGSWNWVVEDIYTLRTLAGRRFPGVPYFLLGHSMGSFLLRTYLVRYPGTVDGAIIMGTGHMPAAALSAAKFFVAQQILKVGDKKSSAAVTKLSFGTYNRMFAPNRTAFDWITVSTAAVDAYIKDPLCGDNPTMGLFREMLSGMTFMGRMENIRKMNANTPMIFLSGSMDPVGSCGKGVQQAFHLFQKAGMRNVSIKLYPGLRHEILNEDCREVVFRDLHQWMMDHLPTRYATAEVPPYHGSGAETATS